MPSLLEHFATSVSIFKLRSRLKLVQAERNIKFQRAKTEKMHAFYLLSETEIQQS